MEELNPDVANWIDSLIESGYVTKHSECNIMLELVNPVSVVVTPSFEVYNSYGAIHAWEVIRYFEEHMQHPNESARSEFLRNKFSATVMR